MMSSSTVPHDPSPTKLPGFGLPLNFAPNDLFRNALDCGAIMRLVPLREFAMMRLMNEITDKAGWDSKIVDKTIVSKWKMEALASGMTQNAQMTERMFNYCISELRFKVKSFARTGLVIAYDGNVVKSDTIVSDELRLALKSAAAPLERIPPNQRDWHPGSEDIVINLVHPSLFPVVYGVTRILRHSTVTLDECLVRCGEGETLPIPLNGERGSYLKLPYSTKFQWLPCQVDFGSEEGEVKITSYINNLHPRRNMDLYDVVQKIIAKAMPLWNRTLGPLSTSPNQFDNGRIQFTGPEYGLDLEDYDIPEDQMPAQLVGEDDNAYSERFVEWATTVLVLPEPKKFNPEDINDGDENTLNLREEFAERGLQVIVKLANIHLTPEKPEYGGGSWHVEGQLNEHICATALYYYDCSNITDSHLAFRQQSSDIENLGEQDNHGWLDAIFGCQNEGPSVQYIGDVLAKEGRMITFPNILQHRVLPFKLADTTKPGHRKILALFLVDPHVQVISSANVPCQRRDWWGEELERTRVFPVQLPLELQKEVVAYVEDFPISLEEAKKLRLALMEERKGYGAIQDEEFQSATFNLCEH